ncbi:two-component system sensor histidine kinase YesM [Paenibacillus castaneae]|uniref:cache domain-containing sensor histidine kinase n=1 Tax=Paenibacillus castaneae TaxID=474957 RepID=UPI000C9CA19A|nr:histidine kinase [Paenibacillus castaneae]NIK79458.1 two-component system sensor histidine kinase YesM [Paenibacillus castaneae]
MKWKSIRTKLIVFMLIATIVPIVTTMIVFYFYLSQSMKDRVIHETQNLLYQGQRNVSAVLEELNRSSLNVYSDAELYRVLQSGSSDYQADTRVFASMFYIKSSVPDAYLVYLYAEQSHKATIVANGVAGKRADNTLVFSDSERYVGSGAAVSLQPTHLSHSYGFASLQPQQSSEKVFTLHRRIERVPSNDTLGFLSIDVKLSLLTDIVDQLYDSKDENLYIVDDNGYIVFSNEDQQLGKPLHASWYKGAQAQNGQESGNFELNGSLFVYERVQTAIAGWTIVKCIPTTSLIQQANEAVTISLLILAVSLIVIVTAIIIVSLRITAPIKQLVHYMNQVQAGNLNIPIQSSGNDEIALVVIRFRGMMDTINNLILREYKLELANKTNQLKALQAQINPHFLNNTIQIIGTLALELGVPRIYALLSALARMMRYSMDNETRTITLRDELSHLKAYIELQKERYENSFEFHTDVQEELLDAEMPKMILQPVLENYFKHGMDKSGKTGKMLLSTQSIDDEWFEVVVENNGYAIPDKRLAELRLELASASLVKETHLNTTPLNDNEPRESIDGDIDVNHFIKKAQEGANTRIGLPNVFARMLMVYGDGAKLEIENISPQGVRIKLMMKKKIETQHGGKEQG